MEELQLSKRCEIMLDKDPARIIRFNTEDVHLRARLFEFAKSASRKQQEVEEKTDAIKLLEGTDAAGMPAQTEPSVQLMVDLADYFMAGIDDVFGNGTSKIVFADGFDFDAFVIFLNYVMDKFRAKSSEKIEARLTGKKKALK